MFRICAMVFAVQISLLAAAFAQSYVAGIDDLPLMPGLAEQEAEGLVFDKPEGRIVEAVASGAGTSRAVGEYYARVLPQLGWHRAPDGSYTRDSERLVIATRQDGSRVTVRFTLAPR